MDDEIYDLSVIEEGDHSDTDVLLSNLISFRNYGQSSSSYKRQLIRIVNDSYKSGMFDIDLIFQEIAIHNRQICLEAAEICLKRDNQYVDSHAFDGETLFTEVVSELADQIWQCFVEPQGFHDDSFIIYCIIKDSKGAISYEEEDGNVVILNNCQNSLITSFSVLSAIPPFDIENTIIIGTGGGLQCRMNLLQ